MTDRIVNEGAQIYNSTLGSVKVYRNTVIDNSILKDGCSVGDDSIIERCRLEEYVLINRRNYINDCEIGRFSYTGLNTIMRFTKIGRYCSIAPNVDIGGGDHDYGKITTMPIFRFRQMLGGEVDVKKEKTYGYIGNDVWIATGAVVLRKCKVGDGAVVGAGAVVTHDVPPYAIVAGTPARIIGYRFPDDYIKRLLEIRWWDFPDNIVKENMECFFNNNVDDAVLDRLEEIADRCNV